MNFLMVPTHWQQHLPVLWRTTSVYQWRWKNVSTVYSFPLKQTSPPPHLPIFLTQILLKPPIYTIHHPHLSGLTPGHWFLLPSLSVLLTSTKPAFNPILSPLSPIPSSPSLWFQPHVALSLLPSLEEKVQILTWSAFRQQLLGAEQVGLSSLTETSYHLPHDLPCLDDRGNYLGKGVHHALR